MNLISNASENPKNAPLLPLSRFVFWLMFKFFGGIRVTGAENIPLSGGALLCPNHISDFDPVATLVAVKRNDFNALAKSELFHIKFFGWYLHHVGALSINRDSADRAALRIAENVLRAGRLILVFPEGRCSQSGQLQRIQPGAMLLSLRTNVPIIPIGIRGTNQVLIYGSVVPVFAGGGVTITVGKPIDPKRYEQLPHKQAIATYADDVRAAIAALTYQQA